MCRFTIILILLASELVRYLLSDARASTMPNTHARRMYRINCRVILHSSKIFIGRRKYACFYDTSHLSRRSRRAQNGRADDTLLYVMKVGYIVHC